MILTVIVSLVSGGNKPKNLQVLKFERKKDVTKFMKSVAKDLGVECDYCHDMKNKAKDTPKKETARKFFKLVDYINTEILIWEDAPEVTCWSCHGGKINPEVARPEIK